VLAAMAKVFADQMTATAEARTQAEANPNFPLSDPANR
jgi:hypothetical protein